MTSGVDIDLHGLVGVRLLGATRRDVAAVQSQIGMPPGPLAREPEVVIRFVDSLSLRGPLRLVGLDDAAFTEDAFLVLRGPDRSPARVQIPFDRIGGPCEIVCERGVSQVPLLVEILNVTALARGAQPLRAAAFRFNGTGVVTTGWARGGKTETLLAFMAHGAAYVGDELVYLSPDGDRIFGIPEPIRLWQWHLASMPQYREAVSRRDRIRLRFLSMAMQGVNRATAGGARHRSVTTRALNRMAPLLRRQMCVEVPPARLFGKGSCEDSVSPDCIFFTASQEAPEVSVRSIDTREVARRMVFSMQQAQQELLAHYLKFRFAFPDLSNQLIEQSGELQYESLVRALEGKAAFDVRHPYPVEPIDLYDALRPYCR